MNFSGVADVFEGIHAIDTTTNAGIGHGSPDWTTQRRDRAWCRSLGGPHPSGVVCLFLPVCFCPSVFAHLFLPILTRVWVPPNMSCES